ncbi:MAG: molybdate transport system ATP-binding protein [Glaciecola sp.]|jgi:molybdate transport system ATP-binding protein
MSASLLRAGGFADVGRRQLAIDLALESGEIVALVGPNGSGKSTTLQVLVGLHPMRSGRITTADQMLFDASTGLDLAPDRRGLGLVPQQAALLWRQRVRQQVALFARPAGAPLLANAGAGAIDDLLERLGLAELAARRPGQLSGGQAQRVAVARALASSPVALLDEPTSAQDPDGARAVRRAIRDHAAAGGAALVVAHRPEDAWVMADRAIVLDDLVIAQSGSPGDLARSPSTAYVAQVAGLIVLRGEVGTDHVLRTAEGDLIVGDSVPPGPSVGLVRPQAITVHRAPPTEQSARNVLGGRVVALQATPLGMRVAVDCRPPVHASITAEAAAALELQIGTVVWATCKANDVDVRAL